MPTYQYACTACDHRFDAVQPFTEDSLTVCPECAGRLRKVYGAVGVVFKGSGFYRNDSRAPESAGAAAKNGDAGAKDAAGASKDGAAKEASGTAPAKDGAAAGAAPVSGSDGSVASGSSGGSKQGGSKQGGSKQDGSKQGGSKPSGSAKAPGPVPSKGAGSAA